jgi:hypothetical protein
VARRMGSRMCSAKEGGAAVQCGGGRGRVRDEAGAQRRVHGTIACTRGSRYQWDGGRIDK